MIKKQPKPNSMKQADYDLKWPKPLSQKLGTDFIELIMAPDYTDTDVFHICNWCVENPGHFKTCKDLKMYCENQLEDAKVYMFVMQVCTAL